MPCSAVPCCAVLCHVVLCGAVRCCVSAASPKRQRRTPGAASPACCPAGTAPSSPPRSTRRHLGHGEDMPPRGPHQQYAAESAQPPCGPPGATMPCRLVPGVQTYEAVHSTLPSMRHPIISATQCAPWHTAVARKTFACASPLSPRGCQVRHHAILPADHAARRPYRPPARAQPGRRLHPPAGRRLLVCQRLRPGARRKLCRGAPPAGRATTRPRSVWLLALPVAWGALLGLLAWVGGACVHPAAAHACVAPCPLVSHWLWSLPCGEHTDSCICERVLCRRWWKRARCGCGDTGSPAPRWGGVCVGGCVGGVFANLLPARCLREST